MCGKPSSSAPPSSSGSSGRNARPPSDPRSRRPDLRRFVLAFLLTYLLAWPAWLALSPAYARLLAGAANALIPALAGDHLPWIVSINGEAFQVHAPGKPLHTGVRVDARSVHFNWLLLLPLLAGTRALGPGRLRARGAALAVLALVAVHVGFLAGIAEYRLLKSLGTHPAAVGGLLFWSQFYYSVGRVGIPILIWVPVGLRSVLLPVRSPAAGDTSPMPAKPAPVLAGKKAGRREKR